MTGNEWMDTALDMISDDKLASAADLLKGASVKGRTILLGALTAAALTALLVVPAAMSRKPAADGAPEADMACDTAPEEPLPDLAQTVNETAQTAVAYTAVVSGEGMTVEPGLLWLDTREHLPAVVGETAYVWRWDEMTDAERYRSMTPAGAWDDAESINASVPQETSASKKAGDSVKNAVEEAVEYTLRGELPAGLVGEVLGEAVLTGYDHYEDRTHTRTVSAHRVDGLPPEVFAAVELDGAWQVCFRADENAPGTLGEFLSLWRLDALMELDLCTRYEKGKSVGRFSLGGAGEEAWELLRGCAGSPSVERDYDLSSERVSFTAGSPSYGVTNRAFVVSAEGILWTNLADYRYAYDIGKEAAGKLLALVREKGVPAAEREAAYPVLVGTVTEIGEDYFLLDDTVSCRDPAEGKVFTVKAEDKRVARMLSRLRVGKTAVIRYDGLIFADAPTVVGGAYEVRECVIASDGSVLIPE